VLSPGPRLLPFACALALSLAACAPPPRPVTPVIPATRAGDDAADAPDAPADPPASPETAAPAETKGPEVPREADEYTRYELLDPDSAQFHILFEVTAVTPGATVYFNPIRKGSVASGETVRDRATSLPLPFEVVSGEEARRSGLPEADPETDYIRVHLPRPVPQEGGVRLLIEKTYKDAASYFRKGADRIVFSRPLGVRRNSVVLPPGYELVSLNIPCQVRSEADGRLAVSFVHTGPEAAPLVIEARRLAP
jgi:hypothetical protein